MGLRTRSVRCRGQDHLDEVQVLSSVECRHMKQPLLPLQEHCEVRKCDVMKTAKPIVRWYKSLWSQVCVIEKECN